MKTPGKARVKLAENKKERRSKWANVKRFKKETALEDDETGPVTQIGNRVADPNA